MAIRALATSGQAPGYQQEEALRGLHKLTRSVGARSSLISTGATSALGGVLGGSAAAVLVVGVTEMIKAMLTVVSRQDTWVLILAPLLGWGSRFCSFTDSV